MMKAVSIFFVLLVFTVMQACGSNDTSTISDGDMDAVEDVEEEREIADIEDKGEDSMENEILEEENEAVETEESEAEEDAESFVRIDPYDCLNDSDCTQLMVAAHRGYSADHPENSIAALRDAAKLGCLFVEVDVRNTSDDKLVIMHDSSVDRTTDGSGEVSEMSWDQLKALTLLEAEAGNDESGKIPLFDDVLKAAKEEGVMLYVDQKTDRSDLVLQAIENGEYYKYALVRDSVENLDKIHQQNTSVMLMPPVESEDELDAALLKLGDLKIVEMALLGANKELADIIKAKGIKIQQDTFAGDIQALVGNYTGWKDFVDVGVILMQTEMPHLLQPAVDEYNQSGEFPESGPGDMKK